MNKSSKIFIAGASGMVGSAIIRVLVQNGYSNLVGSFHSKVLDELKTLPIKLIQIDLKNQQAVNQLFKTEKPEYVLLAAAKVGGIHANNTYSAQFIYDNLTIQNNVIHAAYEQGVQRLLFLGSSCIYPKHAPQPMKEEHLLTGLLERTNEPYAIAKIAGIKMCEAYNREYRTQYRAVMPTNLYGPNDNFDLDNSHVLPAMIRKIHLAQLAVNNDIAGIARDEARFGNITKDIRQALDQSPPVVKLWGTGMAKREFLHVDDMASACLNIMTLSDQQYQKICQVESNFIDDGIHAVSHINVGSGIEITIRRLAETIKDIIQFKGDLIWDSAKPDGTPRKLMDNSRINLTGWVPNIDLSDGIRKTYQWYLSRVASGC